jgi:hypothetical protein
MFSKNDGKTWEPIKIEMTKPEMRTDGAWDEWDSAELSDGRFLCVFRRRDPSTKEYKQVRWQGILQKKGDAWVVNNYQPAPFEHSGHPELLVTREGVILHIATTGTHWTDDAGTTWHPLPGKDLKATYKSYYYPRSVQTKDGMIYVASHVGSDNAYGKKDQSIILDSFRLKQK